MSIDNEENCVPDWVDDILPIYYARRSEEEIRKKQDALLSGISAAGIQPYALQKKTSKNTVLDDDKKNNKSLQTPKYWDEAREKRLAGMSLYDLQKMYLDAGIPIFPVDQETNRYFPELLPSRSPEGIMQPERLKKYIESGARYFGAILPDNFIIIDLDEKKGHHGIKAFNELLSKLDLKKGNLAEIENGSYPHTVTTGSGGRHLYFRKPKDLELSSQIGILDGVDILCSGHRVTTAGSRKLEGRIYEPNFCDLEDVDFLPDQLILWISTQPLIKKMGQAAAFSAKAKRGYTQNRNPGDITPEKILDWNIQKWNSRKVDYGGYNHFLMLSTAEAKKKGWDKDTVYNAILDSQAYAEWQDTNKLQQVEAMINSIYRNY